MNRQGNFLHARARARERYGLEFDDQALCRLAGRIHRGGPGIVHLCRTPGNAGRILVAVREANRWLAVVYDPIDRMVVTFLQRDSMRWFESRLRREKKELKYLAKAEVDR